MSIIYNIKTFASRIRDKIYYQFRKKELKLFRDVFFQDGNHCSILSMNCFGGHIYQDLDIPYESPTAGLFFFPDDFCSLLEDVSILKRNILFKPISKWKLANDKMPTRVHPYPIGYFEGTDIEIHFLHYYTEQEALDKWNRRISRFNSCNFIAIGFQQNECSQETIKRFEKLPLKKKVFFTNWDLDLPHAIFIEKFKDLPNSPDPYKYVNTYYKYLANYLKNN